MEEGVLVTDYKKDPKADNSPSHRLQICKACPLYMPDMSVCNPNLWMNPVTKQISKKAQSGFIKGCGCLVSRKVGQPSAHCHAGLW